MAKYDDEQLLTVCEVVESAVKDDLFGIVSHLQNTGKLDEFLKITGLKGAVSREFERDLLPTKKVLVIGRGLADEFQYKQKCKEIGICPDNFEFHLEYEDGSKFDFDKCKNNSDYCGIIVGQMAHSGVSKGNYTSVIDYIENETGFPKVVRSNEGGELKLSLSAFQIAVLTLMQDEMVGAN